MSIFDVTIIGVGRMGGALAIALSQNGYKVSQLVTRNLQTASCVASMIKPTPEILSIDEIEKISSDLIFITTQDTEIETIGKLLAEDLEHMPYIFHTSGSKPSSILGDLRGGGYEVASLHPLVSISDPIEGSKRFRNGYFCLEGDAEAVAIGEQIVNDLKGKVFKINPEDKSLYHASAITAAGHFVALFSIAIDMLSSCGLNKGEAQGVLLPLVQSILNNLAKQSPGEALTGTFARGDAATLKNHLISIENRQPAETLEIYRLLGNVSLRLASENGLDEKLVAKVKEVLSLQDDSDH